MAGGGRYHRTPRKRISSPAEVLPKWRAGIDAAVRNLVHRDVFLFGLYTGMRRGEIFPLRWERVDLETGLFRVDETKTGMPLELPITRQLGDILARRRAGGAKFRFHALRNCFVTVAERELMLPRSLTKRLVNHAQLQDVTESYAADWTVGQLREPAQRIADRIDELMER